MQMKIKIALLILVLGLAILMAAFIFSGQLEIKLPALIKPPEVTMHTSDKSVSVVENNTESFVQDDNDNMYEVIEYTTEEEVPFFEDDGRYELSGADGPTYVLSDRTVEITKEDCNVEFTNDSDSLLCKWILQNSDGDVVWESDLLSPNENADWNASAYADTQFSSLCMRLEQFKTKDEKYFEVESTLNLIVKG